MERRNSGKFLNARYWSFYALLNLLFIAGFCCILFKAFQLQICQYSVWLERSRCQTETTLQVPTYRGSIYDRQERLLSFSVPQRSLFADCDQLENPKRTAAQLAPLLSEPTNQLDKKLARSRQFVWIKRHLTDQQAVAVENLKGRGLNLINEYKRFYPYRQVGGQVLGFVGVDGAGLEGAEKAFDQLLKENCRTVGQMRDGVKKCLWLGSSKRPESGENFGVRLTLDAFVQYVAERELEKNVLQYKAKAGEVVVLDAKTSEVLAMANWPFFDPNLSDKKNADIYRNRAVTDSFEPGSTFKVFLVSGALNEGMVKERDRVFCENGRCNLAGHTIKDVHPYGWLTISEVIKYSSNIAASKLALQLGKERYYRYIQAFGFGSLTGINLPGEVKGLLRPSRKWRPIDLATTGFGQSLGVTALQLSLGIGCIANGGEYIPPRIIKEIVDSKGQTVKQFEAKSLRRVIQEKTARQISDMMTSVTEEGGTGVKAAPEGYSAAGKTGTAQVLDPETRRYSSHKYTSIFTGFIPAEEPRLIITVVIHEPQGAIYGGVVAGPVFRNIAAKVLPYLGVPPSFNGPGAPSGPRLVKANVKEAPKASPAPKQENKSTLMPDVSGLSLKGALQRLAPLGIQPKIQGTGKVIGQYPQVGSPLKSQTTVELVLTEVRQAN